MVYWVASNHHSVGFDSPIPHFEKLTGVLRKRLKQAKHRVWPDPCVMSVMVARNVANIEASVRFRHNALVVPNTLLGNIK